MKKFLSLLVALALLLPLFSAPALAADRPQRKLPARKK